jgi:penicillin amidase
LLRDWNCEIDAGSSEAALFELWWTNHLKPALLERLVAPDEIRALLAPGDLESILRALEAPDTRLGSNPSRARDEILAVSLGAAYRDAVSRMGLDSRKWKWGTLHHAYFAHAISPIVAKDGKKLFDVGPFPIGGSEATPLLATYRPTDFRVTTGASVRMVIDVGDWDKSVWINAPGQSGNPRSPHYDDLATVWASNNYIPMYYSKDAVDEVITSSIKLSPRRLVPDDSLVL